MRRFIFIGIFILGVCTSLWADEPQQKFEGFNLQGYDDNGEKAWNVNGETADVVGSEIILSNVDANTFGEQKMNVTARTGKVDQVSGKMHLEKDVVVTSEKGQQLMTDSLDWHRNEDLVSTEDNVVIVDPKMKATGKGMEAHPGRKTVQLKEDVTAMVETKSEQTQESQTVTITSDGPMEVDQARSVATFSDHVVAVQEGQTLRADRMEIHFDKKMSQVSKMICLGNVEIEKGENKSYANKAVYDAATQKLTLSGRPKLIMLTEGKGPFATTGN